VNLGSISNNGSMANTTLVVATAVFLNNMAESWSADDSGQRACTLITLLLLPAPTSPVENRQMLHVDSGVCCVQAMRGQACTSACRAARVRTSTHPCPWRTLSPAITRQVGCGSRWGCACAVTPPPMLLTRVAGA
jgi:hypothetical protein